MGSLDLGTDDLTFELRGPLAWCVVNRPAARNVMTPAMYRGLRRAITITTDEPNLQALVITGTDDVFVPGGDMSTDDVAPGESMAPSAVVPFTALRNSRVPVISAVNGICQASGVMIAMLSDIAVASERSTFRAPELLRGFADMWFAEVLPAHVGVGRARELMLTGRRIDAAEALRIGLVERVVPHEQLAEHAERAALEILESGPTARNMWRRAVNARYGVVDEMTMDVASESAEVQEGFAAFLQKRPAAWSPRLTRTIE